MKYSINRRNAVARRLPFLPESLAGDGFRRTITCLAMLCAFSLSLVSGVAATLSNGQLTLIVRADNGAIDSAVLNGKDFFNAGTPVSDWGMQSGTDTTSFRFNDTTSITQQAVTVTNTATSVTATGTYTAGGSNVAFSRVYKLVAGVNALTIVTTFTNNAASTIEMRYFDTFDPDQGSDLGLGSQTVNDVLVSGGIRVARASATNDLTFTIGSIFGETSILDSGGPFQINSGSILNTVVATPVDGNGSTADLGQHMVYVRSIAPGQTVVVHGVLAFGETNVAAINDFVIAASTTGPGVSTDAPTLVTTTSATLNGSANPYNQTTTASFVYGTNPTLLSGTTTTSTQSLGNGSAVVPFSQALTGLTPGTTYYYRASGTNVNGTNTGAILSFSTGPEIAVEQPLLTNLVDGTASISFPDALVATTTPVKTFTIKNSGSLDLTGLSITKDGPNSADFTVSGPISTTVVGGGSTTFTVTFTPGALGARTAAIHIASNDVDENPFDISLTGNGVATLPQAAYTFGVMGRGDAGFSGYTFGSTFTVVTACTVTDLGAYDHGQDGLNASMPVGIWNAAGTLLSSTTVTTGDTLVGFFRYHALAAPVALAAGQQYYVGALVSNTSDALGQSPASFTVDPRITFNLSVYTLTGSLARPVTNLGSAPAYIGSNFLLAAAGAPEIAIEQAGTPIADGGSQAFGSVDVASTTSLTFTIKNTGNANLTGLTITKDGANPSEFIVTASPTAPVAGPSGTTTFTVQFAPTSSGSRTAAIHIANNDSDENPYDITLTGTGLNTAPVITNNASAATASLSFPENSTATIIDIDATDSEVPATQTITFSKSGADAALFNLSASGVLTFASGRDFESFSDADLNGVYEVTVTATDNGSPNLSDSQALSITVSNVNEMPSFTVGANQTVGTGAQSIPSWIVASDDGDSTVTQSLTYNITGNSNPGLFSTAPAVAGNGTLTFTPSGLLGTSTITLTLTDDASINGTPALTTGSQTFTIRVLAPEMNVTVGGLPSGPGYRFTGNAASSKADAADFVVGIRFTATANCVVTHLSTYDHDQDGLVRDTPVGLWDSAGTLLASTVVRSSDPLQGSFRTRALAVPVALTSGSSYRVGALVLAGDIYGFGQALTMDSRISFGTDAYVNSSSLAFPTLTTNSGLSSAGYFGGNFVLGGSGGTTVADAGSKDFGIINVGNNTSLNFNIENLGDADLTGLTISQSGSSDFSIIGSPSAPLTGPTGTTSFTVKFTPTSGGVKTATLQIANNDSNENPYDITLTGTGNALPVLSMPASPLVVEATSLGTTVVTYSVTASDEEDGPLTPTVNPPSGSAFSLGNTTVNVSATDSRGAVTTGSFIVRVVTPDIAVERGGPVADGSTDNLGSVDNHSSTVFTYTVRNTGTSNLTGLTITKGGTNASEYTVSAVGTIPLAPAATTTFTVTFAPNYIGTRTADIHIASNDLDENPYDINLTTLSLPVFIPVANKSTSPPGIVDGSTYHTFYDAYINSAKRVIYSAQLGPVGVTEVSLDQGTWTQGSDGTLDLLVRAGDDLGNGQTVSRTFNFPRIADSGAGLLQNTVQGTGPLNVVQWIDDGSNNITLFANRTTDYAPTGAFTGFTYTSQNITTGDGYFPSSVVQGGAGVNAVTAANDSGVWKVDVEGTVTAVAREGDSMPVTVGVGLLQGTVKRAVVSSSGYGIYATQVTGTGVTSLNTDVILTRDFASGAPGTLLARTDSQAAGLTAGCKYYNFIGETVNASGKGLFWTQLIGTGVASTNNRALFSDRSGSVALVIRYDDSLSTVYGAGIKLNAITAFWLLDDNSIVINGTLKGTGVTAASDGFAAHIATNGAITSIAREGQALSAVTNATIGVLQRIDVTPGGKIAFLCSLVTGSGSPATTLANNQALLTTDVITPATKLLLIRKGTTMGATTLATITLSAQTVAGNTGATAGMSRLINEAGDTCAIFTLTNTDEGVFVGP